MWLAYCLLYAFSFTSLIPRRSNTAWGARGIHCSHTHSSPGFSGEPGNFGGTSPCFRTIHYWITGVVTSRCSSVCSTKPCCVPSVRLESQEWHWRMTAEDNTAHLKWQGCACMATNRYGQKNSHCAKVTKWSTKCKRRAFHSQAQKQLYMLSQPNIETKASPRPTPSSKLKIA